MLVSQNSNCISFHEDRELLELHIPSINNANSLRNNQIPYSLWKKLYLRVFTWNIFNSESGHSGNTPKWNSLKIIVFIWTDMKFYFRYKMLCKPYPEMKSYQKNVCSCKYRGNILLELVLWHLSCNQKCFVQKNKNKYLSAFSTKLATKSYASVDEDS